ncbi:MAG TPA: hypothetical protein VHY22_10215 [Chthoniobacteraceae bacterium]|jgi:hypothetical protein|nr:hypothetical protein [Chthoniobacteraceae bacterium]
MTTIATFYKADDAHLLRMRLEADGIEAFVLEESVRFDGPAEGVRVQVADKDAAAAREYLSDDAGVPEEEAGL